MKRMTYCPPLVPALVLMLACMIVPSTKADLLIPGGTAFLSDFTGTAIGTGTLLASMATPFTSTLGTDSGTLTSAVFKDAGGILDFDYQITNNLTAPNCGPPAGPACDPLSRETNTDFRAFFTTDVGLRLDGSTLPGGIFVDGTVAPPNADRDSVGDVIGFPFNPSVPVRPGQASNVLVIHTFATNFTAGNASVIDGGVATVAAFEPAVIPEPGTLQLLGAGVAGLAAIRRRRRITA